MIGESNRTVYASVRLPRRILKNSSFLFALPVCKWTDSLIRQRTDALKSPNSNTCEMLTQLKHTHSVIITFVLIRFLNRFQCEWILNAFWMYSGIQNLDSFTKFSEMQTSFDPLRTIQLTCSKERERRSLSGEWFYWWSGIESLGWWRFLLLNGDLLWC